MKMRIRTLRRWCAARVQRLSRPFRRVFRYWQKLDSKYRWRWRAANLFAAIVIIAGIVIPIAQEIWQNSRYTLSAEASQLVGHTDPSLAKQLTYDAKTKQYQFNKDAVTTGSDAGMPAELQKASVGAADKSNAKTYSLDVPEDFSKGVTYHDTNSQLSFGLVPQFDALHGKVVNGHLVFPMDGSAQAVYTLKNNGLKEDIVVPKVTEDTMSFTYDLRLPKTLEVRALPDHSGGVGIYAADPSLFGDIQYGSDKDRQAVEKARINANKTYLVFGLPAPVVKDTDGKEAGSARFELNGNRLSVVAEGLKAGSGPITIDPSVVVTSTSDFQTNGNNEGMIDFGTSGQITRGGLTGGTVGSWATTSSLTNTVEQGSSAVYNGYIYQFGGYTRGSGIWYNTSNYAQLNSDGTVGTWSTTTTLPYQYNFQQTVAYNGYMYLLGGQKTTSATLTAEVFAAPINSNGTLGAWVSTTNLPVASSGAAVTAYGGYIYYFGGATSSPPNCNSTSACLSTAYYAPLNANGTVGTWTALGALTTQRSYGSAVAYNGYMYLVGGIQNSGLIPTTNAVQYAQIKNDGTVGSWVSTNSFSTARYAAGVYVYNGYLYIATGYNGRSDVQYAPVYANGSVGTWQATTSMSTGLTYATGVPYNGYLYLMNGYDGTNDHNDVWYTKIDQAGKPVAFGTLSNNFTTARANICSVAYNGYLYAIGGSTSDSSGNNVTTVQYSQLNSSTGNNGSWSSTTALPTARGSAGCVAYNGYLYVIGGYTGTGSLGTVSNSVLYAAINSNGTLAASWTTSGNSLATNTSGKPNVFVYSNSNGTYMYVVGGGCTGSQSSSCTDIEYATVNASTGAVGTWNFTASSMSQQWPYRGYAMVGKYMYAFGGWISNPSAATTTNVEYTSVNSDGTLATWQSTTALNTSIGFVGGTTVNGCIYAVGGENSAGTSLSNVQYACPAANGAISAWYNSPNLTVATTDMGVTSYNGYIYGVGGYTTSVQATTQYAYVNNGGSGVVGSWSTVLTDSSLSKRNVMGIAANGYLYMMGGMNSSGTTVYYSDVYYAPLNADGSIGTWTTTTSLPTNWISAGIVAYNGRIYIVGGGAGATPTTAVSSAAIASNGTLGSWRSETVLPGYRSGAGVGAWNGRLYVAGGNTSGAVANTIVYSSINASDGTLGSWSTASNSFTTARQNIGFAISGGYMYVGGGSDLSSNYFSDVQLAQIQSGGDLGAWRYTAPLDTNIVGPLNVQFNALNGFLYAAAGYNGTTNSLGVAYARITADGSLSSWYASTAFTGRRNGGFAAVYNGYMYEGAGYNGEASYYNTVQVSAISSISRTARYSKIVDLGNPVSISSITYNGTENSAAALGNTPISFRAAGNDGVFGSVTSSSAITAGPTACLATSQNYKRYLLVTITLDDTNAATFADANGTLGNITDFTVNYITPHPAPNIRLRHGQTMQTGNLSPLDSCFDGLLASYGFNEGTGTTAGSARWGTMTVGPSASWATGHSGGSALSSSGGGALGGYTAWNNMVMTNATIMAWCKPTNLTAGTIRPFFGISQGNDASTTNSEFNVWAQRSDFGTANMLQGNVRVNGTLQPVYGPALTNNTWVHIALSYDGANIRLYVNGSLYATVAASGANTGGSNYYLNVLSGSGNAYGVVDDVRVYAGALSASDIAVAMNTSVP